MISNYLSFSRNCRNNSKFYDLCVFYILRYITGIHFNRKGVSRVRVCTNIVQ